MTTKIIRNHNEGECTFFFPCTGLVAAGLLMREGVTVFHFHSIESRMSALGGGHTLCLK